MTVTRNYVEPNLFGRIVDSTYFRQTIGRAVNTRLGWVLLGLIGLSPYEITLGINNRLVCSNCDRPDQDCSCGNRQLEVAGTSFELNGEPVSDEVFQAEFDRFYRKRAAGQILERVPQ